MTQQQFEDIDFKAAPAGQIAVNQAKGIVEAFVAGIGNKDSVGDICAPGAFNGSLKRRKPRVVWGHNWNDPIGKVLEIYEVPASDPRLPEKMKRAGIGGLYAKVQFNLNSEKGKEAFANVQFFGLEQEWSIGYKTLDAVFDPAKQANVLKEVELYEVSPVLHGANQLTGTISIKGAKKPLKDPKGGLTAAGRAHFNRTEGANLKPGVRGAADTPQKMRRKGSFLTRFFTNPSGPMKKPNGKPTRLALSAAAWGEPVPQDRSDAAKLAAKGRRMLKRYENSKKKDAQLEDSFDFAEFEAFFDDEFTEIMDNASVKELAVDIDFDIEDYDEKGHMMMRMMPVRRTEQRNRDIFAEGEAQPLSPEKRNSLEMEIASRVQAPIKVMSATDNLVVFAKKKPDGTKKFYRLPYHWDQEEQEYMFGKPERVMPQMTFRRVKPRTVVVPSQMPGMPMQVKPSETTSRAYVGGTPEPTMANVFGSWEKDEDDQEKSLEYMASLAGFEEEVDERDIVIGCDPEDAFRLKSELDPIFEYHNVEVEVTDIGIKVLSGASEDFLEAVATASKTIFGGGSKKALRSLRRVDARFDPNAIDGDEDGLVQEGTPFERPATPRMPKASEVLQGPQGMASNRDRDFQRLKTEKDIREEIDTRVQNLQERLDELKSKYGTNYDKLWQLNLVDGSKSVSSTKEAAWAIVGADGKGYGRERAEEVDKLLTQYDDFLDDVNGLAMLEDDLDQISLWVQDLRDEHDALVSRIDRDEEELTERVDEINEGGKRLRMNANEWDGIKSSSNPEQAADKWLSDNFDAETIEDEGLASVLDDMLRANDEAEDIRADIRFNKEDLKFYEDRVTDSDTADKMARDPRFAMVDTNPYANDMAKMWSTIRSSVDAYRKETGNRPVGMASRRSADDIAINAPANILVRHANVLNELADRPDTNPETATTLRQVADDLTPSAGNGSVKKSSIQRAIDALNSAAGGDDSGPMMEAAEFLSRAKNGSRKGVWTDGALDPELQKINDFGPRSSVTVPKNGITMKLNANERGDIRRAFEDEKNMLSGIAGFREYDTWLQGSSEKMDRDMAVRILGGFNEYAKRTENRGPNPTIVASRDIIDFASLDPGATYTSPNVDKDAGMSSARPMVPGMTKRNMADLLSWGQNESDPIIRDRFAGREMDNISPKGWAILDGARQFSGGMRSERDDDSGPSTPGVQRADRDTSKPAQRGRPVGTEVEDGRFKGKKWEDIKPEGWDDLTADERFDNLFAFYSPNKSGMREVDFNRLVAQVSKEIDKEEKLRERRERRRALASDGQTNRPQAPAAAPRQAESQPDVAPEADEPAEVTPAQFAEQRKRDLKKIDNRIAGNSSRLADSIADGEADESHRDVWDALADISQESDDLTYSAIESMRETLDDYMEQFQGEDLTAAESASMRAAKALLNLLEEMSEKYSVDSSIEQGDASRAVRAGGIDVDEMFPGMASARNYRPTPQVMQYVEARTGGSGMRSERAGRTQIIDEATYFKDVERSLPKEIQQARSSGDRGTAKALEELQRIMSRQQSGQTGDRRTNVGTITVTQEEVDEIMDALMVVVDRQMETNGSRVVMFSKLIDLFAEAAMGTFIQGTTEEITSRTQTRTNSQGRSVQIPNS